MAAAPQQQQQQPQQPSSSAAASTEQRAPLFSSGVLPVMLQHPAISRSHMSVCRLLCSSRALRSAVLQHAIGMVELGYTDRSSLQQLCSWLSIHGHLLRALMVDEQFSLASSFRLVYALQAAAAAMPGGLRLQKFTASLPSMAAGLVLQQLPPQHLTRLWLTRTNTARLSAAAHDPCLQATAWALAGLTNLSALLLDCELEESDTTLAPWLDPLLPVLSGLSRLTQLHLSGCSKGRLPLLPQQLEQLTVYHVTAQPAEQLQLGHLTTMKHLHYRSAGVVQAGDALPPNLLSLEIQDCSAIGLLAALTQLTRLELQRLSASMSVARLVSGIAGRLRQLHELWVAYDDEAEDAAAAAGPPAVWPAAATAAVLPPLGLLVLDRLPRSMFIGAADVISRLSSLTRLVLMGDYSGYAQDVAALDALARVTAALPRLQEFAACRVQLGRSPAAVALLSTATRLTCLRLRFAGLSDLAVSQLFAFGLTGLRSLDLLGSGVSLPLALMIVGCLPHLTALNNLSAMGGSSEADNQARQQIEAVLRQRRQAAGQ